jgi:hypothetical protein
MTPDTAAHAIPVVQLLKQTIDQAILALELTDYGKLEPCFSEAIFAIREFRI